jgi:hypothetical protein
VDRRKLRRRKLARHDIIDDGQRFVGFEHPVGLISRFVMAFLTWAAQSVGIARPPPFRELSRAARDRNDPGQSLDHECSEAGVTPPARNRDPSDDLVSASGRLGPQVTQQPGQGRISTCPVTWTSSCSASTAAAHVAEGCCSTGSWSLLSRMDRFVTRTLL